MTGCLVIIQSYDRTPPPQKKWDLEPVFNVQPPHGHVTIFCALDNCPASATMCSAPQFMMFVSGFQQTPHSEQWAHLTIATFIL